MCCVINKKINHLLKEAIVYLGHVAMFLSFVPGIKTTFHSGGVPVGFAELTVKTCFFW